MKENKNATMRKQMKVRMTSEGQAHVRMTGRVTCSKGRRIVVLKAADGFSWLIHSFKLLLL